MTLRALIIAVLFLAGVGDGQTLREVFSNIAVHLAITCGDRVGSGFIFVRVDPSNAKV